MNLRYLKRNEINTKKWDACIENSTNPLIYGLSWYLDAATNNKWDALIWDDYSAVLPLPWNRKLLFKQVYMPRPTQHFSIFNQSNQLINDEELKLNFNQFVQYRIHLKKELNQLGEVQQKLNLILPLNKEYSQILLNYRKNRKKDIKQDVLEIKELTFEIFQQFFYENSKDYFSSKDFKVYLKTLNAIYKNEQSIIRAAFYKGEIVACLFFSNFVERLTLLASNSNSIGYKLNATANLLNSIIYEYSNQPLILDFEGSEIEGVKEFFKSFGAIEEFYYSHSKQSIFYNKVKQIQQLFFKK